MVDFKQLQQDVYEWSEDRFPGQPDVNPYMGIVEELGELKETEREGDVSEEEVDGVGDILVYIADFCARRGIDYQEAYTTVPSEEDFSRMKEGTLDKPPLETADIALGRLSRSILKQRQGIRQNEERVGKNAEIRALGLLIDSLESFAIARGFSIDEAITFAWEEEVVHRSWDSSYQD